MRKEKRKARSTSDPRSVCLETTLVKQVKTLMERNEAYGYGTGVPSSFGEPMMPFNYMNNMGGANFNYSLLGNTNINNNINTNPYFDPFFYNTTNTTTIQTALSPNYFEQCTNTSSTNPIANYFQGAPLSFNLNNNIGVAQNEENMLVNSSVQQPLIIDNTTTGLVGLQNYHEQEGQQQQNIIMGVNNGDHLGSLVFSDGESNNSTINGHLNKKKRNVIRNKRSNFLPFDQFDYNQHVPPPQPARVCYSILLHIYPFLFYQFLSMFIFVCVCVCFCNYILRGKRGQTYIIKYGYLCF